MSHLTKSFNLKDRDYIEAHLDTIKEKLAKQGYHLTEQLDSERRSGYGFAFQMTDGKVMKITSDDDEWLTSSKLLNKQLKHVVDIYRVFMFKSMPGVAFILQEKLYPLTQEQVRLVDDLKLSIMGGSKAAETADLIGEHYNLKHIENLEDYFGDQASSETAGREKWKVVTPFLKNLIQKWDTLSSQLKGFFAFSLFNYSKWFKGSKEITELDNNIPFISQLLDTLNELVDNKIDFRDTQGRNLMQTKEGVLKWIDLGGSSHAPGTSQMEHIEGMVIDNKEAIRKNLDIIKSKLEKQGYHLTNQLGEGTYGIAFETQNGRVVKITTDESELESSAKLLKKKLKHVVEIYKVFTLSSLQGIGFIEQEKLKPISKQEAKFVDYLDMHGSDTIEAIDELSNFYDLTEISELEQEGFDPEVCPRITKYWPQLNIRVREFILQYLLFEYDLEKLDAHLKFLIALVASMGELYDNSVAYTDTSGSNLMRDSKGILKWIDLGDDSQVIGPGEVEQIKGAAPPLFRDRQYILDNIEDIKKSLAKQGYILTTPLIDKNEPSKYGVAYKTQDGKVLKITTDEDELETSSKLINQNFKHIVHIYRVFVLSSIQGIGFILQEYLNPLSQRERQVVADISFELRGTDTIGLIRDIAKHVKLDTLDDLKTYMIKRSYLDDPEVIKFTWEKKKLDNIAKQWDNLSAEVRAFIASCILNNFIIDTINENLDMISKILESLDELYDAGIHFIDTHSRNLMKDSQGNLKWIDLGSRSSAPGESHIEQIKGAKQVGPLYHYTKFPNLLSILKSDKLIAETANSISFTRDKNLHNRRGIIAIGLDVRLDIDGDKLSENYKLEPHSYLGQKRQEQHFESEERTKKITSIKHLSKYIKSITIFKNRWPYEWGPKFPKFEILLERYLGMGNVTFDNYIKYLKENYSAILIKIVER